MVGLCGIMVKHGVMAHDRAWTHPQGEIGHKLKHHFSFAPLHFAMLTESCAKPNVLSATFFSPPNQAFFLTFLPRSSFYFPLPRQINSNYQKQLK